MLSSSIRLCYKSTWRPLLFLLYAKVFKSFFRLKKSFKHFWRLYILDSDIKKSGFNLDYLLKNNSHKMLSKSKTKRNCIGMENPKIFNLILTYLNFFCLKIIKKWRFIFVSVKSRISNDSQMEYLSIYNYLCWNDRLLWIWLYDRNVWKVG